MSVGRLGQGHTQRGTKRKLAMADWANGKIEERIGQGVVYFFCALNHGV